MRLTGMANIPRLKMKFANPNSPLPIVMKIQIIPAVHLWAIHLNKRNITKAVALIALILFPLAVLADQDSDFLAARKAFRAGKLARFDRYAARLKHSPMEPYLAYYRLRMHLMTAKESTIRKFLARPNDTPLIDHMRRDWLKVLGKRKKWTAFSAEYLHLLKTDTTLTCYAMKAGHRSHSKEALLEVKKLWLSSKKGLPKSCTAQFNEAIAKGIISTSDLWIRIRRELEAGKVTRAKKLAKKLPRKGSISAKALKAAAANPQRYLSKIKLTKASKGKRLVALFALQRLSKRSSNLALKRWLKISGHFKAEEQRYFYAWLGYKAARKLDRRALSWFNKAGISSLTEIQLEWRARSALRLRNWEEVRVSIAAMQPEQQQKGVWRYWDARALKQLGHVKQAKKVFVVLSKEFNFYGQLAAEEIAVTNTPHVKPVVFRPSKKALKDMLARPAVQRTIALYRMDLRTDAYREWAWTVRNFNDKQLLVAAEIARRNKMYDRAINTAVLTVQLHDFSLRYLAPYRKAFRRHIIKNQLDEAWVYGLMRQESRFVTHAKSRVGAAGLMQIMPSTARWIARRLGMKHYRNHLINELDTNLTLGTYYMKTVLGWFNNNPVLASAAYNAGPSRARRWRGDIPLEGAIYAETIPFNETRSYVQKVMSNTVYYAQQFGKPPRSLKQRMGIIEAKTRANQTPIPDEK